MNALLLIVFCHYKQCKMSKMTKLGQKFNHSGVICALCFSRSITHRESCTTKRLLTYILFRKVRFANASSWMDFKEFIERFLKKSRTCWAAVIRNLLEPCVTCFINPPVWNPMTISLNAGDKRSPHTLLGQQYSWLLTVFFPESVHILWMPVLYQLICMVHTCTRRRWCCD